MAITNAQQYQQLVNKPANGKRPGYRGDNAYGSRSRSNQATSSRAATSSSSNRERGAERNRSSSPKQSTYSSEIEDEIVTRGDTEDRRETQRERERLGFVPTGGREDDQTTIREKEKDKYERQFTSRGLVPPGADTKKRQRALDYVNRGLSRYFDRFEEYYDEDDFGVTKTGYPNFGFPNFYDAIGDELTARKNIKEIKKTGNRLPVGTSGNSYELSAIPDLDIDSIRELASVQTTKQGAPLTGYQANALEDLKRNIENRDTFLETGDTSVIYPDPPEATNTGSDPDPVDPCLGPNPPAYCKVNNDDDDDTTTRNLGGLAPRFAGSIFDFTGLADGGRAGAMDGGMMSPEGGIMDLESGRQMYFLGKLVKKATRAVKKVAKSPFGKMALMAGLSGMAGFGPAKGLFSSGKGLGFKDFLTKSFLGPELSGRGNRSGGILGFMKNNPYLSILGGSSILAGLSGKGEDEGEIDYGPGIDIDRIRYAPYRTLAPGIIGSNYQTGTQGRKDGGRMGYAEGSKEPVAKETMPLLDMDGQEMDLRAEGGFVPLGRMERADDVPARLSKNEFVFTADAVRNAGEGDIDKGAEVMYNMMKNLESGGEVSEESQGLDGAREMFQTSQRLEEVL